MPQSGISNCREVAGRPCHEPVCVPLIVTSKTIVSVQTCSAWISTLDWRKHARTPRSTAGRHLIQGAAFARPGPHRRPQHRRFGGCLLNHADSRNRRAFSPTQDGASIVVVRDPLPSASFPVGLRLQVFGGGEPLPSSGIVASSAGERSLRKCRVNVAVATGRYRDLASTVSHGTARLSAMSAVGT